MLAGKEVIGTLSNLFLAFSGFQCNPMGGDEGRNQQATRRKAIDHMFGRSLKFRADPSTRANGYGYGEG
jgi:hypothetical protein